MSGEARREGVELEAFIRDIPDFPSPGIVFKDITPLLLNPPALDAAVARLARFADPGRGHNRLEPV